jgi:hypothetical protein
MLEAKTLQQQAIAKYIMNCNKVLLHEWFKSRATTHAWLDGTYNTLNFDYETV